MVSKTYIEEILWWGQHQGVEMISLRHGPVSPRRAQRIVLLFVNLSFSIEWSRSFWSEFFVSNPTECQNTPERGRGTIPRARTAGDRSSEGTVLCYYDPTFLPNSYTLEINSDMVFDSPVAPALRLIFPFWEKITYWQVWVCTTCAG